MINAAQANKIRKPNPIKIRSGAILDIGFYVLGDKHVVAFSLAALVGVIPFIPTPVDDIGPVEDQSLV